MLVLRLVIGLGGHSPHIFPDEIGYAAGARSFVTEPPFALGPAPLYYPLYSLLISPAFALGLSVSSAFTVVMIVNALLGAATAGAVYVATRVIFGASRRAACWAAIVVGVYPGHMLFTASIWAENLLPLLVVGWLLSVHWFLRRITRPRAAVVVVAATACYAAHPRAVVVLMVTVMLGGVLLVGRRRLARADVAALLVVVFGTVVGYLVTRQLIDIVLGSLYRPSTISVQEGGSLDALFDPGSWGATAVRFVGETWYQLAATAGLAALGIVELFRRSVAAVRGLRDASAPGRTAALESLTPAALLTVVVSLAVGAAAFLADGSRADNFMAGRYVDAAAPLVMAAGVVSLWESDHARRVRLLVASAMALGLATAVWLAVTPTLVAPRPFVGDMALGLLGHVGLVGGPRGLLIALVGLALIGVVALVLVRRVAGLAALVVVFAALALSARYGELSRPFALAGSLQAFADDVATMAAGSPVGVDLAHANANDVGILGYQWFRPDLRVYDLKDGAPPRSAWVIGPLRWTRADELGAELVRLDPSRAVGLYVLSGSQQEQARRLGALLPSDFPAVLPVQAARSAIEGPTELRVPIGESRSVRVLVAHQGTESRWPRFDPAGAGFSQARIRVGARVIADAGAGQSPVATFFGDLPSDLLPGEQAQVSVRVGTMSSAGGALGAGEYRLVVDIYQVGVGWFSERYNQTPLVTRLLVVDR